MQTQAARPLALLLVTLSCTTVPVTGRKELNLVGEGTMNQLGVKTYEQALSQANPSRPRTRSQRSSRKRRGTWK